MSGMEMAAWRPLLARSSLVTLAGKCRKRKLGPKLLNVRFGRKRTPRSRRQPSNARLWRLSRIGKDAARRREIKSAPEILATTAIAALGSREGEMVGRAIDKRLPCRRRRGR